MPLCTTADIEALLQIDVTNDVDPMVVTLIELAGAAITAEVGRSLEAAAYTDVAITAPAYRTVLLLPHWPLASVDGITEDGVALVDGTDYLVDLELAAITRITDGVATYWSTTEAGIVIGYTTTTPAIARAECARLAANAFVAGAGYANRDPRLQGVKQLTIGRWSATAETGATARPGILLDAFALNNLAGLKDRQP